MHIVPDLYCFSAALGKGKVMLHQFCCLGSRLVHLVINLLWLYAVDELLFTL